MDRYAVILAITIVKKAGLLYLSLARYRGEDVVLAVGMLFTTSFIEGRSEQQTSENKINWHLPNTALTKSCFYVISLYFSLMRCTIIRNKV